jgi:hypothetical protein
MNNVMGRIRWQKLYQIRAEGPEKKYLSIGLGKAQEYIEGIEANTQAIVRVTEDDTIEIVPLTPNDDE